MTEAPGSLPSEADVVIVGSGPAGLGAAAELRACGVCSVVVLEREAEPGGVPRHCGHSPYGLREFRRPLLGPAYAWRLAAAARSTGARIHTATTVTAVSPGPGSDPATDTDTETDTCPDSRDRPVLTVTSDAGVAQIAARAILLATGTRETTRAGRFLGGTKPGGILVTGALQNLVYGAGSLPFEAPVILGSELVSFSAILTCRHAGIRPLAMVEPGPRITARHPAQMLPRMLGIPLLLNTTIHGIMGQSRVEAIVLDTPEGLREIAADGLLVTGRFRPEAALARAAGLQIDPHTGGPVIDESGRTTRPGVYAAGNLLRPVETAGWCWDEGRGVARAIAADLAAGRACGSSGPAPSRSIPLTILGDALKFAVPQRLSDAPRHGLGRVQLRVVRPSSGRLGLRVNGHEIAGRTIRALPERRLLLPLPPARGRLDVTLTET